LQAKFSEENDRSRECAPHSCEFAIGNSRPNSHKICPAPLPTVPNDYPQQLRALGRRLRLTQAGLARRIGAAGKAVIYQWESRKRTPSPVLWQQVMRLQLVSAHTVEARGAGPKASHGIGITPSQDGGGGRHTEVGIGL